MGFFSIVECQDWVCVVGKVIRERFLVTPLVPRDMYDGMNEMGWNGMEWDAMGWEMI